MIYLRRIVGRSMTPAFKPGRLILFIKHWNYKPGDVVMFRHNGAEKIKRIDRIEDGKFFVLGDNPTLSTDSRHFGHLSKENLMGRTLWPRKRLGV